MIDPVLDEIEKLHCKTLTLEAICAILIGELSVLSDSPADKLSQITAGLQGIAAGVAAEAGLTSLEMTQTIARVTDMAERILVQRKTPRG